MHVYVDSSALIKRVFVEKESTDLLSFLDEHYQRGDLLTTSSLGFTEVSRVVLAHASAKTPAGDLIDEAISGIDECPIAPDVLSVARRVDPMKLRTLDAIHLATAILIDADVVVTYDDRLADACRRNLLAVASPGRA
jgi:predicted nucleic acid-binding protein